MGFDRITTADVLAMASAAGFVALAAVVGAGIPQGLDDTLRQVFRPGDVWSTNQLLFGNVVDGLGPPVALGLLALAGVIAAVRARQLWPLVFATALAGAGIVLTVVSKAVLRRSDPHGDLSSLGGAFPSGHMVMLLVSLGGAVLLLRGPAPWWVWAAVAVVGLTMAVALLFLSMHWFSDIAGGVLLAVPIVALAYRPAVSLGSRT